MSKGAVQRPRKRSEYEIRYGTREAEKGWRDVSATQRNAVVDAWDFLTQTPRDETESNYPLKGVLSTVTRGGTAHQRWQHKLAKGARVWFYVDSQTVVLEQVHTAHPNETK